MLRAAVAALPLLLASAAQARTQAPLDPCTLLSQAIEPDDPVAAAFSQVGVLVGDTLMIGSTNGDGLAPDSGTVIEFTRTGGAWAQSGTIVAPDGAFQDYFGRAVDMHGDTLVVGSLCDSGTGYQSGAVYVFTRTGTQWSFAQKLVGSGVGAGDWFGTSVDLDGDSLAVGCTREGQGVVYLFERGGGTWVEVQRLLPDLFAAHEFGTDVVLEGDLLAASSPHANFTTHSGDVYVFELVSGAWRIATYLKASDAVNGNAFGAALAMEPVAAESVLLVGAPLDDPAGLEDAGSAYVFVRDALGWHEQAKLNAPALEAGGRFGTDVALSQAGVWAAVGERGLPPGGAQLFFRSPTDGAWKHQARLDTHGGAPGVAGASLALDGEAIAQLPPAEVFEGVLQFHTLPLGGLWTYCTAKTDSQGCAPQIGWLGEPSLSGACTFWIQAQGVLNQQLGLLVYGTSGAATTPFAGGILCVNTPLVRTWPVFSGGHASPAVDCSGALSFEFSDWLASPLGSGHTLGQVVFSQFWYRDPFDSTGAGLSDALGFPFWP